MKVTRNHQISHSQKISRGFGCGFNHQSIYQPARPCIGNDLLISIPMLLLGGLISGLVFPLVPEKAAAVDTPTEDATNTNDTAISITVPDTIQLDLTPDFGAANFNTASATVSVTTTNTWGYSLTMGTAGEDSSGNATTALIHESNLGTVPSITAATTEANFPTNSWGYTTNNNGTDTTLGQITAGSYQPLTTSSDATLLKKTSTTATADTTTVTFGVKMDTSIPSGAYKNEIVFSATANPAPDLFGISTMQDMTADVCSNTTTPAATALTNFDTDGTHKGDSTYVPQTTLTDTRDNSTYTARKLADGNCWMTQNLAIGGSSTITLKSTDSDVTSDFILPASSESGFSDYDTSYVYIRSGSDSVNGGTYGGYYSWYAATAGTGTQSMSNGSNTSVSICPKGWTLPTGGSSGQFQALYTAYSSTYASLNSVFPLTLSGYYFSHSRLDNSGSYGYWWSSAAYNGNSAYHLLASSSSVNPVESYNKFFGYSVRCVARSS